MDKEDTKIMLSFSAMFTVIAVALIIACTLNAYDRRDKWEKAVSNGADPMVTTCALYGAYTHGETAICTILAQNRK